MAATPATAALEAAGIDFTTTEYEVPTDVDGYGHGVVEVLGLDPATVGKTLVAMVDERAVVAVVPVAGSLDLKALARAAGAKRATMADQADAERLSGSVVGGIAPLGHRTKLAVFIDASFLEVEQMHVSGGRRGLEVAVAPDALVTACSATVAPIAR